jgi:hypothetical protein
LGLVAGRQELIVQSIDLARLVYRDILTIPGGLAVESVLNRPFSLMNRRPILGHCRLRQE